MAEEKSTKEKLEEMFNQVNKQLESEPNIITRYELNIVRQTIQQVYMNLFPTKTKGE